MKHWSFFTKILNVISFKKGPPKKIEGLKEQIGTQLGATENISLFVVSNPQPTIEWQTQSDNCGEWTILPEDRYQYNIYSWIKIRTDSDFRQYTFLIKNTVNKTFLNVYITAQGMYSVIV